MDNAPQEIVVPEQAELVDTVQFVCPKCGREAIQSVHNKHMCVDCEKVENTRITYYRQHQANWIDVAKESGLDLWERQPGETQREFTIWVAFRDSYPGKKPTYGDVAKQLGTTYNVVKKVAQRWQFPIRMQAWIAECDRITLLQRRQEILDMNKSHVDMAARLRSKLSVAIDNIDPLALEPKDINSLAKLAAEMERKARTDTIAQEELRRDLTHDVENPELKKVSTKQSDLSEIVGILMGAGALGNLGALGVKETTTTTTTREVVAANADGSNVSRVLQEVVDEDEE